MERDWRSSKEEEEEEEEEPSGKGSWRRDAGRTKSLRGRRRAATSRDFRGGKHGSWSPTREKEDLTSSVETLESVPAGVMDRRDMPAGPPFAGEAWAAAIDNGSDRKTAVAEEEHPTVHPADLEKLIGQASEPVAAPSHWWPSDDSCGAERSRSFQRGTARDENAELRQRVLSSCARRPHAVEAPKTVRSEFVVLHAAAESVGSRSAEGEPAGVDVGFHGCSRAGHESGARGDVSFETTTAPDEIEVVSGVEFRSRCGGGGNRARRSFPGGRASRTASGGQRELAGGEGSHSRRGGASGHGRGRGQGAGATEPRTAARRNARAS